MTTWKVYSCPLPFLAPKLKANFIVTISNFTECERRIGSGRIDAQRRLIYIPCLASGRYSCLSVPWFFASYLNSKPIVLLSATHVPVGEDQTQHLELSRDIADIFNRTFDPKKRFFPLPLQLNSMLFLKILKF